MADEEAKKDEVTEQESAVPEPTNDVVGVNQDIVEKWKEEYTTIFATYHLGVAYVYRAFNYREFRNMKELLKQRFETTKVGITPEEEMQQILTRCVLNPTDFGKKLEEGDLPGGLPSVLYESIMQASGFNELYPDIISKTT